MTDSIAASIDTQIDELKAEYKAGWPDFRNTDRFEKVRVPWKFTDPYGNSYEVQRVAYLPIGEEKDKTVLQLQQSRSHQRRIQTEQYSSFEDYDADWDANMQLKKIEKERIYELEHVVKIWNEYLERTGTPQWAPTGYCDVGFKYPVLCKHYGETYGCKTLAVDLNQMSVELARHKGYETRRLDLMGDEVYGLEGYNLLTINHVIEHVPRPDFVLNKLMQQCDDYTLLQIEVPIEDDSPKLEFGHMIGFHAGDLLQLCQSAGFTILSQTHVNIAYAHVIDRVHIAKVPR